MFWGCSVCKGCDGVVMVGACCLSTKAERGLYTTAAVLKEGMGGSALVSCVEKAGVGAKMITIVFQLGLGIVPNVACQGLPD